MMRTAEARRLYLDEKRNAPSEANQPTPEAKPAIQPPIDLPALPPAAPPPPPPAVQSLPEDSHDPKQGRISDVIMVVATVFIAVGTLVSAGAICFQWYEMHAAGVDTKNLVEYARQQTGSASSFAHSTDSMNTGIANAVTKLDLQAKEIEESRKYAEQASAKALQATIDIAR